MVFRTCDHADIASAVALSKRVFKDNMAEQFLCLFHAENKDRMFVAVDETNVVRSLLCYYPSTVWMAGASIRVGAIGSVCTDEAFRGKGLASRLLRNAYETMAQEGIPVSIISGGGGIYEASGATLTGAMMECRMKAPSTNASLPKLRPVQPSDMKRMWELNQREAVRFDRTLDEFKALFQGQTYPDTFATYPSWIIEQDGIDAAYVVGVLEQGKDELGLKEYAGDRHALISSFAALLQESGKESVHFASVPGDTILEAQNLQFQPMTQHASLRLNDPVAFFEAIRPLTNRWDLTDLHVSSDATGWKISDAGKEVRFRTIHELNRFVFGFWTPSKRRGSMLLQNKLSTIFPVRFPWTHNLNYQ